MWIQFVFELCNISFRRIICDADHMGTKMPNNIWHETARREIETKVIRHRCFNLRAIHASFASKWHSNHSLPQTLCIFVLSDVPLISQSSSACISSFHHMLKTLLPNCRTHLIFTLAYHHCHWEDLGHTLWYGQMT